MYRYSLSVLFFMAGSVVFTGLARADSADQRYFDSPKAAMDAFISACDSKDQAAVIEILGPAFAAAMARIDEAEVQSNRARLVALARQVQRIEKRSDTESLVLLGRLLWPFPIPIVLEDEGWRFGTEAGLEEILRRRVGRNELTAIAVCRIFADAQREYASQDRDGDGVLEYAQTLRSGSGKQDGLYWEANQDEGEPPSPLGPYLARAEATGESIEAEGFNGYHFRVLTAQGEHAPGGALDYVVDGNMTEGFALVAWPVDYKRSGVVTFTVNHLGAVYEKDLGVETEAAALAITEFDPDDGWTFVTE